MVYKDLLLSCCYSNKYIRDSENKLPNDLYNQMVAKIKAHISLSTYLLSLTSYVFLRLQCFFFFFSNNKFLINEHSA